MSTLQAQLKKTYNFGAVVLTIGGLRITGFADDGGIEFELGDALYEKTVGADGQVTYALLNDDSMGVTVTLKETSSTILPLTILINAQIASASLASVIPPIPFSFFDPATGDTIFSADTVFMSRPALSKGRSAGDREFTMDLPGAAATQVAGANIF